MTNTNCPYDKSIQDLTFNQIKSYSNKHLTLRLSKSVVGDFDSRDAVTHISGVGLASFTDSISALKKLRKEVKKSKEMRLKLY